MLSESLCCPSPPAVRVFPLSESPCCPSPPAVRVLLLSESLCSPNPLVVRVLRLPSDVRVPLLSDSPSPPVRVILLSDWESSAVRVLLLSESCCCPFSPTPPESTIQLLSDSEVSSALLSDSEVSSARSSSHDRAPAADLASRRACNAAGLPPVRLPARPSSPPPYSATGRGSQSAAHRIRPVI